MPRNRFFIYAGLGGLLAVCLAIKATDCSAQSFHTAAAKSPEPGTMFIYPERIRQRAGGLFTAERGLMFVPLNRTKPNSDVIGVEFYRFPRSENAKTDTPPIFILNGGPGFQGLEKDLAKPGFFEQQIQSMLDISDVVVVGQRGIGSSKPDTVVVHPPAGQPKDDQTIAEVRKAIAKERKFWIDQGVDLSGFNVLECASDVRDVAQALSKDGSYKKITITGGSFGSHWGMALMRKHPEIVARAVLTGMEGPDHTWDHPGWYWNVYKRVAEDAESSDSLKKLIPEGGLIATMTGLVKKAEKKPFSVTIQKGRYEGTKVTIDGNVMRVLANGYSPGGLISWPADVINMSRGDFQAAARHVYLQNRSSNRQNRTTASFWMLDSGSGITDKRRTEYESDPAMKIIGSTFAYYAVGSPVWETDLGDAFRQNFETGIPTVIVHGTWDKSTPFENALELKPWFKNSKFITVKRGSHGAMGEAMRAQRSFKPALMKFLETGDTSELPDHIELPVPKWVVPADE